MKALTRTLSRLAEAHRSLRDKARATKCTCPEAIQNLGVALELHRTMLDCLPESARALLDEGVVDTIYAEGTRIAENLAHLASVTESEPGSPEIEALAEALLRRMQTHLEWNDRAVFRPLSRFYLENESSRPTNHNGDGLGLAGAPSSTGDQDDPDS